MVRVGHTEAIVDLAKMAGLYPAGVIPRYHWDIRVIERSSVIERDKPVGFGELGVEPLLQVICILCDRDVIAHRINNGAGLY